ncbi:MAG TPA: hypothetical protein VM434_09645 [Beijerinckiaceae bacterium]|nr:hypothetical protein [Beijerinckiaceae bacterium]
MSETIVRSIAREYRIRTGSPELGSYLAFLEASPEIEGAALTPVEITADPVSDGFLVTLPGRELREASVVAAANRIHQAIFTGIQEEAAGAPLVHGACVVQCGRRMVLVGRKGSGKSTLTLHLLARGFDVEGDEHVVLREADLIAKPRRMRVKPGSLRFVPALAEAVLNSPTLPEMPLQEVYAVDPSVAGRPWRIRPGRADHLVFLEPNHGGGSALRPLDADEAFRRLAGDCLVPERQRIVALTRLRRLVHDAPAWLLSLGDLFEAEEVLRNCCTRNTPVWSVQESASM